MTTPTRAGEKAEDSNEELGAARSEKSQASLEIDNGWRTQRSTLKEEDETGKRIKGAEEQKKVDVPPNGGYGWVCVAACATING